VIVNCDINLNYTPFKYSCSAGISIPDSTASASPSAR
jgi:hypothetical protein